MVGDAAAAGDQARMEVFFRGRVQGVGFRWTTLRAAQGHAVSGFVRNLPDGRVELVAEGAREDLQAFLGDVAAHMRGYVDEAVTTWLKSTGSLDGFAVRR